MTGETKVVKEEVTTTTVKNVVAITFTEDEAEGLFALIGAIGGAGKYREITDKLYTELKRIGVSRPFNASFDFPVLVPIPMADELFIKKQDLII